MKPKRILLARHGESVGNVDKSAYARIPDYAFPPPQPPCHPATTTTTPRSYEHHRLMKAANLDEVF